MQYAIHYSTPTGEIRQTQIECNKMPAKTEHRVIAAVLDDLDNQYALEDKAWEDRSPAPKLSDLEKKALDNSGAKILSVGLISLE